MIRPITCVCFLLACGSGLYLYQAKHRVNVLDREIEKTVHATEATREQIRLLHAEWTVLNQPDRLQSLADQFLTLQPTKPSQFTSMADLDSRLPPIPPVPAPQPPADTAGVPVAAAMSPALPSVLGADSAVALAPTPVSVAAKPVNAPPAPPRPRPSDLRPVVRAPAPVVAAAAEHSFVPEPRRQAPLLRPAVRPIVVTRPVAPVEARYAPPPAQAAPLVAGSLLGMAHSQAGAVAPPAPMPMHGGGQVDGN